MKIAIVHDFLNQYGGAERVVEVMHEMFPEASVYTSVYLPDKMSDSFREMDVRVSFMQKLPGVETNYKKYFLIYPFAFDSFDLSGYDLILSSSSSYAKGIKKSKECMHICYCHTPARFIWRYDIYMEQENVSSLVRSIVRIAANLFLKKWDLKSNENVDYFLANSGYIRQRIKDIYDRDSYVIHPPVSVDSFSISDKVENYYLIVSRLNAYKKIDIVIEAFNELGLPLVVVGGGPHKSNLEGIAKDNIKFIGKVSDNELLEHYKGCKAFIFPGEEDFGITPVEAQASGRPVIAYGKGGALETVVDGKTGLFFKEQTSECLINAIKRFEECEKDFDPKVIRENAERFSKERFKKEFGEFIEKKYCEWRNKKG
ncbi:MAG: glycosyltransferase [Candidatus Omnitrophica bacterium]|nr:glycosyltransferase [Candidatus Omnitrophota bacterium]